MSDPSIPTFDVSDLVGSFAVMIGAGWGCAVGLPSAARLIAAPVLVPNPGVSRRARSVLAAYASWLSAHPDKGAEQFLSAVQDGHVDVPMGEGQQMALDLDAGAALDWHVAVEFVGMRLATCSWPGYSHLPEEVRIVSGTDTGALRYGDRLSSPSPFKKHLEFWPRLGRGPEFLGVVTTNYDLTIERSLRDSRANTACHYGGLGKYQRAVGESERRGRRGPPTFDLRGSVPLCKLHGSLNWARTGVDTITIYQDSRPAYAHRGTAMIVAPVQEKSTPEWLRPVWMAAEELLSAATTWLVVGYSLPDYDHAIRDWLTRASAGRPRIVVCDPSSATHERWGDAFPQCEVLGRGPL